MALYLYVSVPLPGFSIEKANANANPSRFRTCWFQSRCRDSVLRKLDISIDQLISEGEVSVPLPGFSIEKVVHALGVVIFTALCFSPVAGIQY